MAAKRITPNHEQDHAQGLHDVRQIEACPLCQSAAQESARVRRIAKNDRSRTTKGTTRLDPRAAKLADLWRSGSSLAEIVDSERREGRKAARSALRRLITQAVGGKAEFSRLRSQGAGGSPKKRREEMQKAREEFKASGKNAFFIRYPEDAYLPVISSAKISDGWRYRYVRGVMVHTDPQGVDWVRCQPNEKADMIYHFHDEHKSAGLPDVRLRKFETSSSGRRIAKEAKVEQAIKKATVTRKAARRARRKGGV